MPRIPNVMHMWHFFAFDSQLDLCHRQTCCVHCETYIDCDTSSLILRSYPLLRHRGPQALKSGIKQSQVRNVYGSNRIHLFQEKDDIY